MLFSDLMVSSNNTLVLVPDVCSGGRGRRSDHLPLGPYQDKVQGQGKVQDRDKEKTGIKTRQG